MRYEIVNPSDECSVTADGPDRDKVAAIVGLLLGDGAYGIRDESGAIVLPIVFNGWREWYQKTFGVEIEPYMLEHAAEVASCLDTFVYARERSSLNNIGRAARETAVWLRECAARGAA